MKKIFVLSMLISVGMVCSCQKQDSAAEQQLAQQKAELDAREKALAEREKGSKEKGKPTVSARTILPNLQSRGQVRDPAQVKVDPAQVKAERDRRLQQLSPDVQALMPNPSQLKAQRDRITQQLFDRRQRALEEQRGKIDAAKRGNTAEQYERMKSDAAKKDAMSAAAASPAAEATSPPSLAASPETEATSPSPSPTPQ